MVFVKWPTGHECQLWVDEATGKMYYYDMAQWLEYEQSAWNDGRTYWPTWETVDWDDDMWVYDTNNPTDLFTWESGDKVSYVFKDWNGTVLKEGKVNEGTAPTPPADPTREATAEYTYTFTGWNPTVAPITKKTTYTAQYEASPRNYTVTIGVSPEWAGTVDTQQVTVAYGTEISYTSNVLMIGSNEITATAETGYQFSSWGTLPETVTENLTITATFDSPIETLYSWANGTIIHDKEAWTITYTYTGETTAYVTTWDTLIIADKDIWATSYDVASTDSVWYCYQWGNNYWFPHTWALQTSDVQVDASSYTASTYSSSTFVTGGTWDSSNNKDLWGWETWTDLAKKWPCPDWYHIPSKEEIEKLENIISAITWTIDSSRYALVPYGIVNLNRNTWETGYIGSWWYWTCTSWTTYPDDSAFVAWYDLVWVLEQYECAWFSIRPFKNKEPEDYINELLKSFGKSTIDDLEGYSYSYLNGDVQTQMMSNPQTAKVNAIGIWFGQGSGTFGVAFVWTISNFDWSWYRFQFISDGSNYVVDWTATLVSPDDQETYNALVIAQSSIRTSAGVQNIILNETTGTVDVPNSQMLRLVADVDGTTTPPTWVLKNFTMWTSSNYTCNFVIDGDWRIWVYGLTPIV